MGDRYIFVMGDCVIFALDDCDSCILGSSIDRWNNQIFLCNRVSIHNFSLHDIGCCVLGLVVQQIETNSF